MIVDTAKKKILANTIKSPKKSVHHGDREYQLFPFYFLFLSLAFLVLCVPDSSSDLFCRSDVDC